MKHIKATRYFKQTRRIRKGVVEFKVMGEWVKLYCSKCNEYANVPYIEHNLCNKHAKESLKEVNKI